MKTHEEIEKLAKEWLTKNYGTYKPSEEKAFTEAYEMCQQNNIKTQEEIENLADEKYLQRAEAISDSTIKGYIVSATKGGYVDGYNQCQQDNAKKSIKFSIWLCENYGRLDYDGVDIKSNEWSTGDGSIYSTEELYEEFIQILNE